MGGFSLCACVGGGGDRVQCGSDLNVASVHVNENWRECKILWSYSVRVSERIIWGACA